MTRAGWLAALLLLLATALRLHGLGTWSLDGDELYSWYDVQLIREGAPWPSGARTFPLGYLLMAGAAELMGLSELALRLPSVLFSILAVATLLFARRDVLPAGVRLTAGLIATLSPWLLYLGQSARFYGPQLGLATVALVFSLPGPGRRPALGWICLALAVLCHPTALLLAPALLVADADARGAARRLLVLGVLGLAGLVVLRATTGSALHEVVAWWAGGRDPAHYGPLEFLLGLAYNLGPEVGLLAAWGAWSGWRDLRPQQRVLLSAAIVPALVLLAAGLGGLSVYQRYVLVSVPAVLLLAGHGLVTLPRGLPRWIALAVLVLAPAPRLVAHLVDGSRHDTRAVAAFLAEHADPDDALLLEQHATIELYLHAAPGFADIRSAEAPVSARRRHAIARQVRESWAALKANHRGRPEEREFHAWVDEVYTEVARIGRPPWPLVRHDNQYVIYRRTRRLPPEPFEPAANDEER